MNVNPAWQMIQNGISQCVLRHVDTSAANLVLNVLLDTQAFEKSEDLHTPCQLILHQLTPQYRSTRAFLSGNVIPLLLARP